ncbi:hypothetical protein [Spiroplasma sp. DGKH1]|uniref:hypothetical protein n=1 Tax=Spiroplasma sp. DGKH1 TaxID=3050074 RepID=UPI0034C6CB36
MNIEQIDIFFKYRNKKFGKKIKTEQELKSEKEAYFYLFEKYLNKILKYYTFNLEAYIISTLNNDNWNDLLNLLFIYEKCLTKLNSLFKRIKNYKIVGSSNVDKSANDDYQKKLNDFSWNQVTLATLKNHPLFLGMVPSFNFAAKEIADRQELILKNFNNLFIIFEKFYDFNKDFIDKINLIIRKETPIGEKNDLLLNIQAQFIIYFKSLDYSQNPASIMARFISGIFWNFYRGILVDLNQRNGFEILVSDNEWNEMQGLLTPDHQTLLNNFNIFNNNINEKIPELFQDWENIINNYIKFNELDYNAVQPSFLIGEVTSIEWEKWLLWTYADTPDMRTTLQNTVNFLSKSLPISIDPIELFKVSSNSTLEKWNLESLKSCFAHAKIKKFLSINCCPEFSILYDLRQIFGYHPKNTCVERFQKIIIYKLLEAQILEQTGKREPKLKTLNEKKKRMIQEQINKHKLELIDTTINLDQNLPGSSSR